MSTLHWMGFTFPPECATYWVGEVGQNPKDDRKKRLKNESTKVMAQRLARNLAYYAQLLHHHPIKEKELFGYFSNLINIEFERIWNKNAEEMQNHFINYAKSECQLTGNVI